MTDNDEPSAARSRHPVAQVVAAIFEGLLYLVLACGLVFGVCGVRIDASGVYAVRGNDAR